MQILMFYYTPNKNQLLQHYMGSNLISTFRLYINKKKLVVDIKHQKVIDCDATFETNDNKVIPPFPKHGIPT